MSGQLLHLLSSPRALLLLTIAISSFALGCGDEPKSCTNMYVPDLLQVYFVDADGEVVDGLQGTATYGGATHTFDCANPPEGWPYSHENIGCSGNSLVIANARLPQLELTLEGVDLGEQSTLRPEYN